jgi:hypothetical protein
MDEKEKILHENYEEYYSLGLEAYQKEKYNSATTLFFKAIVTLCDLFIYKKEKILPSSHTNRFRILEKYKDIYLIVDRDFPFYQDSYLNKMDKDTAELLKDDIEELNRLLKERIK